MMFACTGSCRCKNGITQMRITVLGCSGGTGCGLRTTALLLDDDILIDAGTGVGDLAISRMAKIRHIFLTHSHLDHVAGIPLMIDTVFDQLTAPVTLHGRRETLQALQAHIFNWVIWPDFSQLPSPERPAVRYQVMAPGEKCVLDGRSLEMIAVNHTVPAAGYRVECTSGAFAFSGDTTTNDDFWEALNRHSRLDLLMVEAAFADNEIELSRQARHYCPQLLAADLGKLHHHPEIYVSHLKPGFEHTIYNQCRAAIPNLEVRRLFGGEVFQL